MNIDVLIPTPRPSHVACCLMQGCVALGHAVHTNASLHDPSSRGISTPFAVVGHADIETTMNLAHELLFVDVSDGLGSYTYEQLAAIARHRPVVLLNMADDANFRDYADTFVVFSSHLSRIATRRGQISHWHSGCPTTSSRRLPLRTSPKSAMSSCATSRRVFRNRCGIAWI